VKTQKRDIPAGTGTGGGKFLKIEIGQSVNGVFRGEAMSYWQRWPKGGVKETSDEPKPGFAERFKINFVVHEEGAFISKIFDCNVQTYNQIAEINESMDIEAMKCKISRQPTGKGSMYMVLPLLKEPLKPKALAEIEATELHSLGPQANPQGDDAIGF
jgi:hypothetical protein